MSEDQLKIVTVDIRSKLQKRELKLTELTIRTLKQYRYGLAMYFPESVSDMQTLKIEISDRNKLEQRRMDEENRIRKLELMNKPKDSTMAQKCQLKFNKERETGGGLWASFIQSSFGFSAKGQKRQEKLYKLKENGQNIYQSISSSQTELEQSQTLQQKDSQLKTLTKIRKKRD